MPACCVSGSAAQTAPPSAVTGCGERRARQIAPLSFLHLLLTPAANSSTWGMPKRKEPPLPPKEQFKRFVEAVREREADESGKELNAHSRALPSPRKRPAPNARDRQEISPIRSAQGRLHSGVLPRMSQSNWRSNAAVGCGVIAGLLLAFAAAHCVTVAHLSSGPRAAKPGQHAQHQQSAAKSNSAAPGRQENPHAH